jgi:hypothetical protein
MAELQRRVLQPSIVMRGKMDDLGASAVTNIIGRPTISASVFGVGSFPPLNLWKLIAPVREDPDGPGDVANVQRLIREGHFNQSPETFTVASRSESRYTRLAL